MTTPNSTTSTPPTQLQERLGRVYLLRRLLLMLVLALPPLPSSFAFTLQQPLLARDGHGAACRSRPHPSSSLSSLSSSSSSSSIGPSSSSSTTTTGRKRRTTTTMTVITATTPRQEDRLQENDSLRVGFLGCGTIASAIVTGMATQTVVPIDSIIVTERSQAKSKALATEFPNLVTVVPTTEPNQRILDSSDLIFLTVLPQQVSNVLGNLTFDPHRHTLVSLVSTTKLKDLVKDSYLDASRVSKMICLPSIARHQGVTLHCNPAAATSSSMTTTTMMATLRRLLDAMGGVVTLETEAELEACMMTTCTMGPLYGILKEARDWLLEHTTSLSKEEASLLVIHQCTGAILDADRPQRNVENDDETMTTTSKTDPDRLEGLIEEQTPGGLNEQALANFNKLGGAEGQRRIMDAILSRIQGNSDGSV